MEITSLLNKLQIQNDGSYDNKFYIIKLENSDEYSKMYTKLDELAINTEEPSIQVNTNKTTVKITNYFEFEDGKVTYNLFLIANFETDDYYLKIGEK